MFKVFVCFMQQQCTTIPAGESSVPIRPDDQPAEKEETQSGSFSSSETADQGQVSPQQQVKGETTTA